VGSMVYSVNVQAQRAQGAANHIKVFRDGLPWDSSAFETVMADNGYTSGSGANQYEILTSDQMSSVIMTPGEDMVIIMNDQDQTFYDNLAANYSRFQRFIDNGGVILWEACDNGWAGGSMAAAGLTLPGGVTYSSNYDPTNYVVNTTSALTSGLTTTVLTGNYSSHENFSNLPENTTIYTTDTKNLPTLIEFKLNSGWVILTGQPLEWGYDRLESYSIGELYPLIYNYVLNTVAAPAAPIVRGVKMTTPDSTDNRPSHIQ
jgi:hypothetical protein